MSEEQFRKNGRCARCGQLNVRLALAKASGFCDKCAAHNKEIVMQRQKHEEEDRIRRHEIERTRNQFEREQAERRHAAEESARQLEEAERKRNHELDMVERQRKHKREEAERARNHAARESRRLRQIERAKAEQARAREQEIKVLANLDIEKLRLILEVLKIRVSTNPEDTKEFKRIQNVCHNRQQYD